MKLTSFHLDGSRVFLAPIGPGLNIIHCPTGDRAASVSDSLRGVLFGAMSDTGWPTPDGALIGSVDITDETGSGRISRRRAGYGVGPLELTLHDGRTPALNGRIDEMSRSTGRLQIIDFGNGRELSEVAIKACLDRMEAHPHWQTTTDTRDHQTDRHRERLNQRERELSHQLADLKARRDGYNHQPLHHSDYQTDYQTEQQVAVYRRRQQQRREELASIDERLSRTTDKPSQQLDPRVSAIDSQIHRVEQVCDDLDSRQAELNRQMQQHQAGADYQQTHSLDDLRGLAVALERQLTWLDTDQKAMSQASREAERWEMESGELRRTVIDLLDTIHRQEHCVTIESLRNEVKQLRRCRNSLRQRLRRLRDQQAALGRGDSLADSRASLLQHRERVSAELESIERQLQQLQARPNVPPPTNDFTRQIHAMEAELEEIRRALRDTAVHYHSAPAAHPLLHRAAQILSRVSEGELVTLRYDAPASTLFVVDYEGKPHASYDLPVDVQRLVGLSLLLSVADNQFPVVLDRIFEETPETATASILEVLRDACRHGMQVLTIVYDVEVADRLQRLEVDLRHADWAAPQARSVQGHGGQAQPYGYHAEAPGTAAPYTVYQPEAPAQYSTGAYAQPPAAYQPAPQHVVSTTAPVAADIWDTPIAHPYAGRPDIRRSVAPQKMRVFEDSHRPIVQAEAHSHLHHLDYADSVTRIPFFGQDMAERLEQYGYWTVADFIRGDADEISQQVRGEVSLREYRTWQAQCQLMCGIGRLRAFDAKILVACGITDPLQIQTMEPVQLMRRVAAFVETPEGRQLLRSGTPFEVARIQRWVSSGRTSGEPRQSGGRTGRYARRVSNGQSTQRSSRTRESSHDYEQDYENEEFSRPSASLYSDEYEQDERDYDDERDRSRSQRSGGSRRSSSRGSSSRSSSSRGSRSRSRSSGSSSRSGSRSSSSSRSGRSNRSTRSSRSNRSAGPSDYERTERAGRSPRLMPRESGSESTSAPASTSGVLKFYLDMNSDVEAAPTIGPKTASLLYEIGIHTVGHLLEATPSEVAEQLGHSRINSNNVLEWQLQSALVCRVPELRGHDSQILVACGVTEAEQLAAYEPNDLFAIVQPFVNTKAGKRIVRGGKAPDLEEITGWIEFAKQARAIKAA